MKTLSLLALSIAFIAGCSNAPAKKDEATAAPQEATKAAAEKATTEVKQAEQKVKAHAETAATAEGAITCTHGKDVRTLTVEKTATGGCELQYKKGEAASSVASAKSGSGHCEAVANKIKTNLTASGFNCQ